jgi:hypothetical protein
VLHLQLFFSSCSLNDNSNLLQIRCGDVGRSLGLRPCAQRNAAVHLLVPRDAIVHFVSHFRLDCLRGRIGKNCSDLPYLDMNRHLPIELTFVLLFSSLLLRLAFLDILRGLHSGMSHFINFI